MNSNGCWLTQPRVNSTTSKMPHFIAISRTAKDKYLRASCDKKNHFFPDFLAGFIAAFVMNLCRNTQASITNTSAAIETDTTVPVISYIGGVGKVVVVPPAGIVVVVTMVVVVESAARAAIANVEKPGVSAENVTSDEVSLLTFVDSSSHTIVYLISTTSSFPKLFCASHAFVTVKVIAAVLISLLLMPSGVISIYW